MKVKDLQALLSSANPESNVCLFQHVGAVVTDQVTIHRGEHFQPTDRYGLYEAQEGEYVAIGLTPEEEAKKHSEWMGYQSG